MERSLVIGCDVRYMYEEDDRMNVPEPTVATDSVLYRAELTEPGSFGGTNLVAVKTFRIDRSEREAEQINSSDLLMRWENLTKLKHENVVSYHKIAIQWMHPESNTGRSLIELDVVMDYCDGSTLHAMMEEIFEAKRTLHVKTLFDFSEQMANGLAYLHENNIIHGILTPHNILVNKSSMNNFRLRLCSLDNYISSYKAFVMRWAYLSVYLAPEMLLILREGASVVLEDPCFSALHMVQKMKAMGDPLVPWAEGIIINADELMENLINLYATFGIKLQESSVRTPKNCLAEYLRCLPAAFFRFKESHPDKEVFSQFINFLEEICISNSASAQKISASVLKREGNRTAVPKAPDDILESVMSFYLQRIRSPSPNALTAKIRSFLQSRLLSLPGVIRADGRKTDIWSLGRIMECLAHNTFDTSQKMKDHVDSSEDESASMMALLGTELESYMCNFIPIDFSRISDSCLHRSADERMTAQELVNKLVRLDEHTYGSTWVYKSQDGVVDEELSDAHRQMLEEIGCQCKYEYSFLRDFIGEGAYGYVHKARVTGFGTYKGKETVAIKEITLRNAKIKQMQQDDSWRQAKDQWRKLVSLRHPHLVSYHKFTIWKLTKGASIEIMMDYCQGGDLDQLITQCRTGIRRLSFVAVVRYAAQLATGLHFLHENKFIHGDLKPGNVFLNRATGDPENHILRIGDLDGAMRIHTDSSTPERKDLAGTGPYMSPEMVMQTLQQQHEDMGFPTDIWSFGCVLLDLANCCTGIRERMFYKMVANEGGELESHKIERQSFSADAFLFQLSQGYRPFVPQLIHRAIRDLIEPCLVPACRDRATSAQVMEQLLHIYICIDICVIESSQLPGSNRPIIAALSG